MDALTSRQQHILDFIRDSINHAGMPPTRAEIQAHFGFSSPNAAQEHLRNLEKRGAIELIGGSSRGIRLVDGAGSRMRSAAARAAANDAGLPLVGRVAAGSPILASEHVERRLAVDPDMFNPRADYLLKVRGMSMRDAGILDGDLLAVHKTSEARSGQVVVARINDEVTVKRLQRKGGLVLLEAENPDFAPIEVDPRRDQFALEGLAVGLLRNTHGF